MLCSTRPHACQAVQVWDSPVSARILLSQVRVNLPPLLSDHSPYFIKFLILDHPPRWNLIPLAWLQQESCWVGLEESPLPLMSPFSNFPSSDRHSTLYLGYKSPLPFVILRIEPSSILRSHFPYCNSFWIKSRFTSLTLVQLWLSLTSLSVVP